MMEMLGGSPSHHVEKADTPELENVPENNESEKVELEVQINKNVNKTQETDPIATTLSAEFHEPQKFAHYFQNQSAIPEVTEETAFNPKEDQ